MSDFLSPVDKKDFSQTLRIQVTWPSSDAVKIVDVKTVLFAWLARSRGLYGEKNAGIISEILHIARAPYVVVVVVGLGYLSVLLKR